MNATFESVTWAIGFGTVVPELAAAEVVPMAIRETLKVLRAAAQLDEFTQPELAAISGASYEMVKKVLRAERAKGTVVQLDRTASSSPGRPPVLWRVADRAAIERAIDAHRTEAEGVAETLSRPGEVPHVHSSQLDAALAAAEDRLVFALSSDDRSDAAGFARDAVATIEEHEKELPLDDDTGADQAGPQPKLRRNVPIRLGRARVIRAICEYLMSDEDLGVQGLLWCRAFDAVASFDHARQAGLHKLFMSSLVDLATERRARSGPESQTDTTGPAEDRPAGEVASGVPGFQVIMTDADGHLFDRQSAPLPDDGAVEHAVEAISTSMRELIDAHG
jgi:hypothetical protein